MTMADGLHSLSTDTAEIMAIEDQFQVATYAKLPVALVRGEGCYVWDATGKRYLDLYGGHCVALVGHCHPRLVSAITEQASKLMFYSNVVYSDVRALAAQRLAALAPEGLGHVFFCNSGTEANETALKMARRHTQRRWVVSMSEGFHGRTLGSLGPTGPESFRDPSYPVPVEHRRVPFGDLGALQEAMGDDVAAVMVEPVLSMGGIRVADAEWYQGMRAACDRVGALLIFDEVQTGFGRTGTNFFGEQVGVTPDVITAAKGVAGGFPAGVVFVADAVAAEIRPGDHGSTFGGGHLACAAMAAVAELIVELGLPAQAGARGEQLSQGLSALPGVKSVSGRGLLLGVNLDRPAKPVVAALRAQGVLVGGSKLPNQLRLLPPLTLSAAEADQFVAAMAKVLIANGA
ncbi:MAG: acetylornithine/N-succinyldiaminopimelate aminotransferase, partial [Pseudohongiellaceae bacterium]